MNDRNGEITPLKRRCKAKAKGSGEQCKRAPEPGADVCRVHGGNAPQIRAKAAERRLQARINGELVERGWDPVTDPLAAFADLVGEVWAFKELCREQIATLSTWTGFTIKEEEHARALVVIYERALDRASKSLVDMMRLGLDAAALRQAKERPSQEQAEVLSRVIDHMLTALDLTHEQHQRVPAALAEALRQEGLL